MLILLNYRTVLKWTTINYSKLRMRDGAKFKTFIKQMVLSGIHGAMKTPYIKRITKLELLEKIKK